MKASLLMNFYDVPGYFLIDSTYRKVLKFSGVKASRNDQLILGTKNTIKILNGIVHVYICVCIYI